METNDEIYFYGHTNGTYACFSNFYPSNFTENNIIFNCSEQYFMYQKCLLFDKDNNDLIGKILSSTNPTMIKALGRKINNFDENIWKNNRENIMYNAIMLKFSQNNYIKQILLNSQPKILYEASKNDKIWGIGFYSKNALENKNNFGLNLLGKCLMKARNDLSTS